MLQRDAVQTLRFGATRSKFCQIILHRESPHFKIHSNVMGDFKNLKSVGIPEF
jgi:hypothetical protein